MLYVTYVLYRVMSRGFSGRVVVEIDPQLKNKLHVRLAEDQLTLKDWFLRRVASYLEDRSHPTLFSQEELRGQPPAKTPEDEV